MDKSLGIFRDKSSTTISTITKSGEIVRSAPGNTKEETIRLVSRLCGRNLNTDDVVYAIIFLKEELIKKYSKQYKIDEINEIIDKIMLNSGIEESLKTKIKETRTVVEYNRSKKRNNGNSKNTSNRQKSNKKSGKRDEI